MSRILLVDDEVMLLDSLEIILSLKGYTIMGKARDGSEALGLLEKGCPDLALVDLNMTGMGGIELIGEMKKLYPEVKILVLTTFYDDGNITDAICRGADGYLLKDSGKDAILGAVAQILSGNTVLDAKVMQRLTALVNRRGTSGGAEEKGGMGVQDGTEESAVYAEHITGQQDPLTQREKEICGLLAEGLSNRQIADRLYISEGTVKNYISSIYDKTGIHDRVKLAIALKQ